MLSMVPIVWRLIAGAVVVGGIAGGITWWSIHQYNKGYAASIAIIIIT